MTRIFVAGLVVASLAFMGLTQVAQAACPQGQITCAQRVGSKSLPKQSSRSLADPNSRASRVQPCPVIGLRQRMGCDADLVTEPSGPCWTSGRSRHRFSKGIVSGSAIYSPCCSRHPSRSLGHLLESDGWLRTKEEEYFGRQAEALRRRSTRSWISHG